MENNLYNRNNLDENELDYILDEIKKLYSKDETIEDRLVSQSLSNAYQLITNKGQFSKLLKNNSNLFDKSN